MKHDRADLCQKSIALQALIHVPLYGEIESLRFTNCDRQEVRMRAIVQVMLDCADNDEKPL